MKSRSNRAEKQVIAAIALITVKFLLTGLFWPVSTRAKLQTDQKVVKKCFENKYFQKSYWTKDFNKNEMYYNLMPFIKNR